MESKTVKIEIKVLDIPDFIEDTDILDEIEEILEQYTSDIVIKLK